MDQTPIFKKEEEDDEDKSNAMLQATVFLEDAINFRSIFHKMDKLPLIVYRCYYTKAIQFILKVNIFVILMLAFLERPSSLSITCDISMPRHYLTRYEFPCGILEAVEIFCLTVFFLDVYIKSYLVGRDQMLKSPWLVAYYVVLFVSVVDCVVSLSLGCTEKVRIRRYLRPFFLIQCSSLMKKTIKSVKRTMPQIISVFVLLTIHVYFFAIIGMLIFPRYYKIKHAAGHTFNFSFTVNRPIGHMSDLTHLGNGSNPDVIMVKNKVFASIKDSLVNLLVLLTSSNNPDVMVQTYAQNRFSVFYFIIYVLIGIYCIMSLVTAVIYNQFKGFFQDSIRSSMLRQSIGVRAAFWVVHSQFHSQNKPELVPKSALISIINNLSIQNEQKKHLLKSLKETNFCIQDAPDASLYVDFDQFENLFLHSLNERTANNNNNTSGSEFTSTNQYDHVELSKISYWVWLLKDTLNTMFNKGFYVVCICLITLVNIGCITAELHDIDDDYNDAIHQVLGHLILGFSIFYVVENLLKIWAKGWRGYASNYLNIVDGVISLTFLLLLILHLIVYKRPYITLKEIDVADRTTSIWGLSRVVNMLLIFRLIHLVPSVKVMYAILSTSVDIVRNLRPLFGIMIVNYYVYALLGMQLFANKIKLDSFDKFNRTYPEEYCGTYKQLNFWAVNFNDFFASLVVLWDVMVINNWQIIFEAFVDVTNEWSRIYFIFWWISCTVITLNMCTSLILDLFVLKWEKSLESQDKHILAPLMERLSLHGLFDHKNRKDDEEAVTGELLKHTYVDFKRLIHTFDRRASQNGQLAP